MRLLIAYLAWRRPWRSAFFLAMLLPMFWAARLSGEPVFAFGWSMAAAFALGIEVVWLMPRPIWYLPVSGRDIWRARWLVATVGATSLTTASKLLLFALPAIRPYGFSSLVLSGAYDFAYAGMGCALVFVATTRRPERTPWRQVLPIARGLAEFALPLGFLAAAFGARYLAVPTHWTDLTARSWTILAVALVITAATYFYSPSPPPRVPDGSLMFRRAESAPAPAHGSLAAPARMPAGRFSGLTGLLIREYVWTLLIGTGLASASAVIVLVGAGLWRSPVSAAELLRSQVLLLGPRATSPRPLGIAAFALLIWYAFFVASVAARYPSMLRHLRVLPLSAGRITMLLVTSPAATWATVWVAFVAAQHAFAGRDAAALHLDLFVGLCGFSAIVQALALRLGMLLRVFLLGAAAGLIPFVHLFGRPSAWALTIVGVCCLAAAAGLNHLALRRSSTYRPLGPSIAPGMLTGA